MNPFYKASLWLSAHLFPGWSPTGSSLEIWPSDNIEMLRDNYKDPLVIKETRIDAVYGLVGLMDEGYLGVDQLSVPTLLLYGEKDEIIPRGPFEDVAKRVPSEKRIVIYEKGYHMLLRDLQRERVWADIASWVRTPDVTLPSGEAWIP